MIDKKLNKDGSVNCIEATKASLLLKQVGPDEYILRVLDSMGGLVYAKLKGKIVMEKQTEKA